MSQRREVSFAEYANVKRGEIVLTYDNAKERALRNFDDMAQKVAELMQQIEIMRKEKEEKPTPDIEPKESQDKSRNKK